MISATRRDELMQVQRQLRRARGRAKLELSRLRWKNSRESARSSRRSRAR